MASERIFVGRVFPSSRSAAAERLNPSFFAISWPGKIQLNRAPAQVLAHKRALLRSSDVFRVAMFAFFSNRLGCIGSILVSVVGSVLLLLVMRGCSGAG